MDEAVVSVDEVREAAGECAARFDLDYWRDHDSRGAYPWEFVKAFSDAGWLGTVIPEKYGGLGLGVLEASWMLHEVAASGAGMSGASAIHFYIFPPGPIIRHGTEEMKSLFLPEIAAGRLLMAFGVTEPNAGVDTSRITTKAVRRNGRWYISGQKVWISNAQNAHRILVLTRTSPRRPERPLEGMTLFFARLDRDRCTIREIDKLGRSAVDSNEVFLDDLEASDDEIVGEVGQGFYHLLDGINPERIVSAMEQVGLGRAALELATEYAKSRVVFDRPIGMNQAVAHPLAEAWTRLVAAELVAIKAAKLYDSGKPCGDEANAAKYLGSDAGFQACDRAMQTHGGYSYSKEYHVERLWRESRLMKVAPISQEMVLNHISTKVLGLPKSY